MIAKLRPKQWHAVKIDLRPSEHAAADLNRL